MTRYIVIYSYYVIQRKDITYLFLFKYVNYERFDFMIIRKLLKFKVLFPDEC